MPLSQSVLKLNIKWQYESRSIGKNKGIVYGYNEISIKCFIPYTSKLFTSHRLLNLTAPHNIRAR